MKRTTKIMLVAAMVIFAGLLGFWMGSRGMPGKVSSQASDLGNPPPGRMIRSGGGWWTRQRPTSQARSDKSLRQLQSLPYVAGARPAASQTGVVRHIAELASPGYNLYSSAHAPEAILMDMEGRQLHRWYKDRDDIWPQLANLDHDLPRRYFRRVHLFENGDLLVIYEYAGLARLDRESNLIWSSMFQNHHDLDVDDQGRIWVLAREEGVRPEFLEAPFWDELIVVMDGAGQFLKTYSVYDCIRSSDYAPLLDIAARVRVGSPSDVFHANTIEVMRHSQPEFGSAFAKGNLLVSLRNLNTIAIIDPAQRKMIWAMTGMWRMQHQPVLLNSGHILLFDNLGGRDFSRVLEFDPLRQLIHWEYHGSDQEPLFSFLQGSNQRLPNGNTLITESDYGRVIEVTPDKQIVWEFNNPNTTGERGEYVAVTPEMIRLPPDFPVASFARTPPRTD